MRNKRIKVKATQRFEFEDKIYFPDEISLQLVRVARRWVSRGIADYAEHNSIVDKIIEHPKVSIVILVKDALYYFKKCIKTLKRYTDNYELIIVDNGSKKKTKNFLKKINDIDLTIIRNKENKGFSYGNNQAIKIAKYNYICFLNSDTLLTPNWLGKLMRGFKYQENVGIVGPSTCKTPTLRSFQILNHLTEKETNQKLINRTAGGLKEHYEKTAVVGFCWVIKKEIFDKVGVFDWKRYGMGSYEDIDLLWRVYKLGYISVWSMASYVHHFGNKTFEEIGLDPIEIRKENKLIFEERKKDPNLYIKNDVRLGQIIKLKDKKGVKNADAKTENKRKKR